MRIFVFAVFILLVLPDFSSADTCYVEESRRTYYWNGWWRRDARTVTYLVAVCCDGWTGAGCNDAICAGNPWPWFSCMSFYSYPVVRYKDGTVVSDSSGYCSSPNGCTGCNKGFYADSSGKCLACPKLANCNVNVCSEPGSVSCEWCENEWETRTPFEGRNEFTGEPGRSQCQRSCSWRNGYRCYPGSCSDTHLAYSSCNCSPGFGGTNCATATSPEGINILKQSMLLRNCKTSGCDSPVILETADKVWTNIQGSSALEIWVSAHYDLPTADPPPYINAASTRIELIHIRTVVKTQRGSDTRTWERVTSCPEINTCLEKDEGLSLATMGLGNIAEGFSHTDKIFYQVFVKNGGRVNYQDWDGGSRRDKTYDIVGIEKASDIFEIEIDLQTPQHCYEISDTCSSDALTTDGDFLKKNSVDLVWSGWDDLNSGLDRFELSLYKLVKMSNTELTQDIARVSDVTVTHPGASATLSMVDIGPYMVEITAYDRAGNHKTARRIFMYDDSTTITLHGKDPLVTNRNSVGWMTEDKGYLEIIWPDRFQNTVHDSQCWLCKVATGVVSIDLDDTVGKSDRNIEAIKNIKGIVRYEIAFNETDQFGSTYTDFIVVPSNYFDEERMVIDHLAHDDGKRVVFNIRAYDVMETYGEDSATIWIDKSPPVIENLWLTKGNTLNLSVHSVTDLEQLTIEWEVYDVHSGLHEISWRIYDNYTRAEIVHGHSYESPQGDTLSQAECEAQYSQYPRGSKCYCTPFTGCFHQHYQETPRIDANVLDALSGLHADKSHGVHESEYFIEVTAVNKANLQTISTHKITIDVSPPHAGHVHDGEAGSGEVDYQQSLTLAAHWDGFLDKESGVWFYMYGFGGACVTQDDLAVDTATPNVFETYGTSGTFTVSGNGKYFVTVVAYNHALDPSDPVCSDGVVVDSTPAVVSEVVVTGAVTTPGIVKDEAGTIYVLQRNRELVLVDSPTQACLDKAVAMSVHIGLIPQKRTLNGTFATVGNTVCDDTYDNRTNALSFVTTDAYVDVSWNVTSVPAGIHDYEVGVASTYSSVADDMAFTSSRQHTFIRLVHPGIWDGSEFYILIKTISKSAVTDIRIVGPFMVVKTRPEFTGVISVHTESVGALDFMLAEWTQGDFINHGDPFSLQYYVAIGSTLHGTDILPFTTISPGASCTSSQPPACAAIRTDSYHWTMHDAQGYYLTIKAINTVGLYVLASSALYTHHEEKPALGVVYDIDPSENRPFLDVDDIDFQADVTTSTARWSGFDAAKSTVLYRVCLQDGTGNDVKCENAGSQTIHTLTGLSLTPYEKYFHHVTATTDAGSVTSSSDGVIIVIDGDVHPMTVLDGLGCSIVGNGSNANSHHTEIVGFCEEDLDYQASTNVLSAHWTIPAGKEDYLQDIFWSIEQRSPLGAIWEVYEDYQHIRTREHLSVAHLFLTPGRQYRIALKLCAGVFCFQPVTSDGVTIIPSAPVTSSLTTVYSAAPTMITVTVGRFYDPDIADGNEALEVMHNYQWSLTDNATDSRLLTQWTRAEPVTITSSTVQFDIPLSRELEFVKCWRVAVKGYTKAGLSTKISGTLRNCSNLQEVRPRVVIDAVGEHSSFQDDDVGEPIFLEQNDNWEKDDEDYTPYTNLISAVWPTLRHGLYEWAVLGTTAMDPTIFYQPVSNITIREPCSHPEAIVCGTTTQNFINADIGTGVLTHGRRYVVCIHANATQLFHEKWTQDLPETSVCSDGVTVDLTPPVAGNVWIGSANESTDYQTSRTDIAVHWDSFVDVEEHSYVVHQSGIANYHVAIGSTPGGNDVTDFTDVGLTNHKTFHELRLQNGHSYYATVKGFDFIGRSSAAISPHVTVDTTPPDVTKAIIKLKNRHITDASFVSVCWTGVFTDSESGVDHYYWSIGSSHGYEDVMEYTFTREDCAVTSPNSGIQLLDGHAYFVSVKAYNLAGLFTTHTSWAFMVDTSPPSAGLVYDGQVTDQYTDRDHVTSSSHYQLHWTAFVDEHTTVKEYYVAIGTCKGCADTLAKQPVGIAYALNVTLLSLAEGVHYYSTVTACNTADFCTAVSSDGFIVDKTAPMAGHVMDGLTGVDIQYQSSRIHIGCKWYGFTDPQSGISHYVWRVGTFRGADDVVPATNVHQEQEAFIVDLQTHLGYSLPVNKRVYCTVRAYNGAGMHVEAQSDGVLVDITAPVFDVSLELGPVGTIVPLTLITRSTLKVTWQVSDPESSIDAQYMSISSHIGGDFDLASTQIEAVVRDYTFLDLDLHDGSYYDIKLTSCNGAQLCTQSVLSNILVDSTHPKPGTFAVNTDHASVLNRQPDSWMQWDALGLRLSWLGFADVHSGISDYVVNVGATYMSKSLNKDASAIITVNHTETGVGHYEGFVQTYNVETLSLAKQKSVYVGIYAVNRVGLRSPILHGKFNLLFGGLLELVRRCDADTCLGHCICAATDHFCHSSSSCVTDIANGELSMLDVVDIRLSASGQAVRYSPVDTYLAAYWTPTGNKLPIWYEWSVGESGYSEPKGVFNGLAERVWHEAGTETMWVFSLPRDRSLTWTQSYSFFIRAWYDRNTYKVYRSPGVTVLSKPPSTTSITGASVKELKAPGLSDVDFVSDANNITVDWANRFINSYLGKYHLYLSTAPGGKDIKELSLDLPPTDAYYNLSGLALAQYTKYYAVVQAYNLAGLHTTASSDGFIVDVDPPVNGVVNDGKVLYDIDYVSAESEMSANWHGFTDAGSGVDMYEYCVSTPKYLGRCDIYEATNVGLRTAMTFNASELFDQGQEYFNEVRARDMAGHLSTFARSDGVVIDNTPPLRVSFTTSSTNLITNPSFEESQNDSSDACRQLMDMYWQTGLGACAKLLELSNAPDGIKTVIIEGDILQDVNISTNGQYVLEFYTSNIRFVEESTLSSIEGYFDIENITHVFLMHEKLVYGDHVWQKHVFKLTLDSGIQTLKIGTVRPGTSFGLDAISLNILEMTGYVTEPRNTSHTSAFTVFSNDWSSIQGEWNFIDIESGISEYLWAVGTVEGGTQLQDFTSVGLQTSVFSSSLNLVHNTTVYVTVVAVNGAGLRTISYSNPVFIDLTPPVFVYIHDAEREGEEQDFQTSLVVIVTWSVIDPESNIVSCSWALGTTKFGTSIQDFTSVEANVYTASATLMTVPADVIYTTVRCYNGAGLSTTSSSDGLKILNSSLSVDQAVLELMSVSKSQYSAMGSYHGDASEVRFRWTGFNDDEGINNYFISIAGGDKTYSEIVVAGTHGFNYAAFTGLSLADGLYEVIVRAVNEIHMYSQRKTLEFYVLTSKPTLSGISIQTSWTSSSNTASAVWTNVFVTSYPLYYEVSLRQENMEGDIVQWQETTNERIEVVLDVTKIPTNGATFKFTVRAINHAGYFEATHADLFVLP